MNPKQPGPLYIDEAAYQDAEGNWHATKPPELDERADVDRVTADTIRVMQDRAIDAYRRTLADAGVPVPSREAIRRVLTEDLSPKEAAATAPNTGPNRHQRRAAAARKRGDR